MVTEERRMSEGEQTAPQTLAEAIHPATLTEKVLGKYDRARNAYQVREENVVRDHKDFIDEVTNFVQHMWEKTHEGVKLGEEEAYGLGVQILSSIEGMNPSEAYRMALTGEEGGLKKVIDQLHEGLREHHAQHYITHKVDSALPDPNDRDAQINVANQFRSALGEENLPERLRDIETDELLEQVGGLKGLAKQYVAQVTRSGYLSKPKPAAAGQG